MMNPINKTSIKIHAFHSCKTSLLLPNESSVIETNKIFLKNINVPLEWGENHRMLIKKPSYEQLNNSLPSITNMVWLRSINSKDIADFGSELVLIWFTESMIFSKSINEIVQNLICPLDWKKYAVDFELDEL